MMKKMWLKAQPFIYLTAVILAGLFISTQSFALNANKDRSLEPTPAIESQPLQVAKGQYMMPGRCWAECGCHQQYKG